MLIKPLILFISDSQPALHNLNKSFALAHKHTLTRTHKLTRILANTH